jgi:hypothetical protein
MAESLANSMLQVAHAAGGAMTDQGESKSY